MKLLSEFLKANNCYEQFIKNFNKDFDMEGEGAEHSNAYFIYNAIDWYSAPEGFDYWRDIYYKSIQYEGLENDLLWLLDEENKI